MRDRVEQEEKIVLAQQGGEGHGGGGGDAGTGTLYGELRSKRGEEEIILRGRSGAGHGRDKR